MIKAGPELYGKTCLALMTAIVLGAAIFSEGTEVNAQDPILSGAPPALNTFEVVHIFANWYLLQGNVSDEIVELCDVSFEGTYTGSTSVSSDGSFTQAVQLSNSGTISAVAVDNSSQESNSLDFFIDQ